MLKRMNRISVRAGFTLIELLVVISIIVLLLSFFASGMWKVKVIATNLRQKSQFHAMEVGLEFFQKDYDNYPDSMVLPDSSSANQVCGAQHFAEAVVGRDLRGFDPETTWYPPGEADDSDTSIYASDEKGSSPAEITESLNRRWPPYMDLKDIGVFVIGALYDNYGAVYPSPVTDAGPPEQRAYRSPVFTEVFGRKKVTLANGEVVKAGTPILYYKANTSSRMCPRADPDRADVGSYIYNYEDNEAIILLGTIKDATVPHELTFNKFYEIINNPKIDTHDQPFNAMTFLLMAPGWDGIFGTKDDITNFGY